MPKHLVFIQSPLHLRNWAMLEPSPQSGLIVAEPGLKLETCSKGLIEDYPVKRVELADLPALFTDDVEAVVFFALHPRPVTLRLIYEAQKRKLPVIAIEESNQIALNNGGVNNYLLPADKVCAASPSEADWMIRQGVERETIEVTGWPFHVGCETRPEDLERELIRKQFGFLPNERVAVFLPIGFAASGESMENRGKQLKICRALVRGGWRVVTKPHPAEPLDFFKNVTKKYAPELEVLDSKIGVEDLLVAADVVLGRGISQTALQACLVECPVIKLDLGDETPFDLLPPIFRVKSAGGICRAAEKAVERGSYRSAVSAVLKHHLPVLPSQARDNVTAILRQGVLPLSANEEVNRKRLWLLAAWKDEDLHQLILADGITMPDWKDLSNLGPFYDQVVMALRLRDDLDEDLLVKAAESFPGDIHVSMFAKDITLLIEKLESTGRVDLLIKLEKRLKCQWAEQMGMKEILENLTAILAGRRWLHHIKQTIGIS